MQVELETTSPYRHRSHEEGFSSTDSSSSCRADDSRLESENKGSDRRRGLSDVPQCASKNLIGWIPTIEIHTITNVFNHLLCAYHHHHRRRSLLLSCMRYIYSSASRVMRAGRYSPAPGSGFELGVPYSDDRNPGLLMRSSTPSSLACFFRWARRKSRILISSAAFAVLLIFLFRRTSGSEGGLAFINYDAVDWSSFAYSQYATDEAYLCNTLLVFEALHRLCSRADRILFYPQTWDLEITNKWDRVSQLLVMARDTYGVKLIPADIPDGRNVPDAERTGGETWDRSVAKLMAFGETQYRRILHVDSDVTIYKHFDDLFLLPSARVAMPRAYWSEEKPMPLTSLLVLLEPSATEFQALVNASWNVTAGSHKYDMELLNERYSQSALVLPHGPFLITGELRKSDHKAYLGNDYETWDAHRVLADASLVHFSDWPLPKPWIMWPIEGMRVLRPKCKMNPGTVMESSCEDRAVWMNLYDDFRRRRRDICKLLSVPAPKWPPKGVKIPSS